MLSGVAGGGVAAAAGESPAPFLNMFKSEIFPRRRAGVDAPDWSASVPAERGRRPDENEGRPEVENEPVREETFVDASDVPADNAGVLAPEYSD